MTYEQRRPVFNFSGTLLAGCSALDTQISSSLFTSLPSDLSTTSYIPLVLANDTQGKSEIVWATGHANGANSVTVVRGREGTTAQTFATGDVVRCSPTTRDVVPTYTRANLPGDAHTGMRALVSDEGVTVEKGPSSWNDSVAVQNTAARRHAWEQTTGGFLDPNVPLLVTGMTVSSGFTGSIATLTAGKLRLNKPGIWAIEFSLYSIHTRIGQVAIGMQWPGGPTPGGALYDRRHISYTAVGSMNQRIGFTGHVTTAQAAVDISLYAELSNDNSTRVNTFVPQLRAELLAA